MTVDRLKILVGSQKEEQMDTTGHSWKIKQLSKDPDDIATDRSEIRWVFAAKEASVVHCTLPPKATSVATRNVDTHEIWYFIGGQGCIWFKEEAEGREEEVGPGTCLTIPAGVHFQYRNTASDPLTFVCVTMPPFESNEQTTKPVEPHWQQ
jgi:mannose-6-phosphate isomerase-like protein (cupin superfamily)